MLRSLAVGVRDFKATPDTLCVRYNWIVLCLFEGALQPHFNPPLPASPAPVAPNFWIIPPQTRYVIRAETRRCDRAVFHFSAVPELVRAAVRSKGYLALRLDHTHLAEVRALARSLQADFDRPTPLSELRFEAASLQLALLALGPLDAEPLPVRTDSARDRVARALAWYEEHLAEAPSLSQVARAVHVSPTHLRRHFHERLGRSPKAIFSKLRMQRAARLLVATGQTLERIAEQCGFPAASDFGRAFKRHFGVTPNAWRHNVNSATPAVAEVQARTVHHSGPKR